MSDILLVSMPFRPLRWPSLGIGSLVAAARESGLEASALYLDMRFAHQIGLPLYNLIAAMVRPESLFAEWLFSGVAFDHLDFPENDYFNKILTEDSDLIKFAERVYKDPDPHLRENILHVRKQAREFIAQTAEEILERKPGIVGCSSSFMQHTASLALLRELKTRAPSIISMLGGANCEAEMGLTTLKHFPWIDVVVSGEADEVLPKLCRQFFKYGFDIPAAYSPEGVFFQARGGALEPSTAIRNSGCLVQEFDNLPVPDYSDYFDELKRTGLDESLEVVLVMESARGCWKGWKRQCTFCGLNGKHLKYRSKSSERVLRELDTLADRHGLRQFIFSDTILHMGYFKTLLKKLAERKAPYSLYFETSSALSEEQVSLLAEAGVTWFQPGIESIHDGPLHLLHKGTSAIQNIALLKFARENRMKANWNVLYNIPGDRDEFYQEMAEILPWLYHLEPPNFIPIRFDRFSKYQQDPQQFGLDLKPASHYQYVYPLQDKALEKLAYFFETQRPMPFQRPRCGVQLLDRRIVEWKKVFSGASNGGKKPRLLMSDTKHGLVIQDTRPCAVSPEITLKGIERLMYNGCRQVISEADLYARTAEQDASLTPQRFQTTLQELIDRKILLGIGQRYLALATLPPSSDSAQCSDFSDIFLSNAILKVTQHVNKAKETPWNWFQSLELQENGEGDE